MSASQSAPFPLRMPEDLREEIAALAKANNHSLNTQIVLLLQMAIHSGTSKAAPLLDVDVLAEALATKLAAKLKSQES